MSLSSTSKRARSQDQKDARRADILAGADEHLRVVGFDAFSMASLAKSVGLAKGTLYLYFQTKEEVFLALTEYHIDAWSDRLESAIEKGLSDTEFCAIFYRTSYDESNLIHLMSRLQAVIEHNVSIDALVQSKRALRNRMMRLSSVVATNLSLTDEQAGEIVSTFATLLLGAAQTDQGPNLENEALPDDVVEFAATFSSQEFFLKNAKRILRCIREES